MIPRGSQLKRDLVIRNYSYLPVNTKLRCMETKTCEKLAQSHYMKMEQLELKPMTSWSRLDDLTVTLVWAHHIDTPRLSLAAVLGTHQLNAGRACLLMPAWPWTPVSLWQHAACHQSQLSLSPVNIILTASDSTYSFPLTVIMHFPWLVAASETVCHTMSSQLQCSLFTKNASKLTFSHSFPFCFQFQQFYTPYTVV